MKIDIQSTNRIERFVARKFKSSLSTTKRNVRIIRSHVADAVLDLRTAPVE